MTVGRRLFLTLALLVTGLVQASEPPTVVLLTALDPHAGRGLISSSVWNSPFWNSNEALEKIFRSRFANSGYNLEVYHDVDAEILWQVLHSGRVAAVFFVGHSAPEVSLARAGGIQAESVIADRKGGNLKDIFKSIHPAIRYLSIVGCKAADIFKKFEAEGVYRNNPFLTIQSFDHLVDPFNARLEMSWNSGLTQAINQSLEVLAKPENYNDLYPFRGPCDDREKRAGSEQSLASCRDYYVRHRAVTMNPLLAHRHSEEDRVAMGIPVLVQRVIPANAEINQLSPLRILMRGQVVGIFPTGKPGEAQLLDVYLDPNLIREIADLKITADTGMPLQSSVRPVIGHLDFFISGKPGYWFPIANARGEPLGVTENIYRFYGTLEQLPAAVSYRPF